MPKHDIFAMLTEFGVHTTSGGFGREEQKGIGDRLCNWTGIQEIEGKWVSGCRHREGWRIRSDGEKMPRISTCS